MNIPQAGTAPCYSSRFGDICDNGRGGSIRTQFLPGRNEILTHKGHPAPCAQLVGGLLPPRTESPRLRERVDRRRADERQDRLRASPSAARSAAEFLRARRD